MQKTFLDYFSKVEEIVLSRRGASRMMTFYFLDSVRYEVDLLVLLCYFDNLAILIMSCKICEPIKLNYECFTLDIEDRSHIVCIL